VAQASTVKSRLPPTPRVVAAETTGISRNPVVAAGMPPECRMMRPPRPSFNRLATTLPRRVASAGTLGSGKLQAGDQKQEGDALGVRARDRRRHDATSPPTTSPGP